MKRFFLMYLFVFVFAAGNAYAMDLSAECACLMIADTGEILFEKNGNQKHSVASTTKIMTGIIALEKNISDDTVNISENAANQEGSSIYINSGDKISGNDLIYGMLLNSGNDAACAIAEHISGSVEVFSEVMTEKAKDLGADNTSFKNPSGLDAENHYSTAVDMAKIASYALQNENFKNIVSTKNSQINVGSSICYLKNHNKLLWNYDGCIGVKTGYTKKTGRCLVSAAERDGIRLIAVTLGAPDDWNDHKKMLDYGFENTKKFSIIKRGEVLKSFDGNGYTFSAIASEDAFVTGGKNINSKAGIILHTIKSPTSDIMKNEKIGYAEYTFDGEVIGTIDLVCDRDVKIIEEKYGFIDLLTDLFKKLM